MSMPISNADVDAHLHRRGTRQKIDVAAFERLFVAVQDFRILLRGMLGGGEIRRQFDDAVVQHGPNALLAKTGDVGMVRQPGTTQADAFQIVIYSRERGFIKGQSDPLA